MTVKLLTEHNLEFLSFKGGCTGLSESTLVKMPHCCTAQMLSFFIYCRPVHGLIFLFKWVPDTESDGTVVQDSRLEKIFFAKQVR